MRINNPDEIKKLVIIMDKTLKILKNASYDGFVYINEECNFLIPNCPKYGHQGIIGELLKDKKNFELFEKIFPLYINGDEFFQFIKNKKLFEILEIIRVNDDLVFEYKVKETGVIEKKGFNVKIPDTAKNLYTELYNELKEENTEVITSVRVGSDFYKSLESSVIQNVIIRNNSHVEIISTDGTPKFEDEIIRFFLSKNQLINAENDTKYTFSIVNTKLERIYRMRIITESSMLFAYSFFKFVF